ncbi:MAG TPA: FliM/FliN family flagellar motor switch protein [Pirellulales bacterium]|nr:FliM/FliN family flagellar motor switch protein [Pirellulales bacterium]
MKPADRSADTGNASQTGPADRRPGHVDRVLAESASDLAGLPLSEAEAIPGVRHFEFREFSDVPPRAITPDGMAEQDREFDVRIELGHTQISRDDLPELRSGSVISLDRLVHEPVDLVVDGQVVARGEVMVLDERFCVRITELFSADGSRVLA